jgi:hypothetical protein
MTCKWRHDRISRARIRAFSILAGEATYRGIQRNSTNARMISVLTTTANRVIDKLGRGAPRPLVRG